MIPKTQRQWLLAAHPLGRALEMSDFTLSDAPVTQPKAGQVLIKTLYLSFDPAQKARLEGVASYAETCKIGGIIPGAGGGVVLSSAHPDFKAGDLVIGRPGWREYPTLDSADLEKLPEGVSIPAGLSVLGVTGMTAYGGLMNVGKPRAGDTLVISGAAGATGSLVGQIGKIAGCRVIGIAGGPDKCKMLIDDLGFDAAIDYKNEKVRARLRETCPAGIDVVFDNVGGDILNDCLARLAVGARVVICGGISRYNFDARDPEQMPPGPRNYFNVVFTGATIQGFLMSHFERDFPAAESRLLTWLRDGRIKPRADIVDGFENAPMALNRLFLGKNIGKQMLKIADA